ncbi:MAG: hypothetical protein DI556_10430 [Rhodovulum sulfidophilum]|uniref:Methyltransferase domain-containing protein n=1 Tax=Rhodovulum sulfidophilum TaxID=35806 RepID=A0A2W5Q579_RHOSU|nr:MAG: hypothetical protein DI556_10430 [Rhodovulum sulfidophilum]
MAEDNRDQADYWNADAGRNWIRFETELDAMHAEATALLLAACAAAPGESVLDIGCGAGGSTRALAREVSPGGAVLGLDISEPLLAAARERTEAPNVRFEQADAQTATLPAAAFDLAASRFGVMFFSDAVAAFRNIGAALRPGGRLAFVAWAGAEHNPWFALPARLAQARLGAMPPAPPEAPGPLAFQDATRVLGLLASAGYVETDARAADIHLRLPGGMPAALGLLRHIGPVSRILKARGGTEADLAAIHADVAAAFAGYDGPDGLVLPARVACFTARWPG